MTTITVQAIYRKGRLEPKVKLNLPENTTVEIQLTPLTEPQKHTNSLFGLFPELTDLTNDDFMQAKSLWDSSLNKQSHFLDTTTS